VICLRIDLSIFTKHINPYVLGAQFCNSSIPRRQNWHWDN